MTDLAALRARWAAVTAPSQARADVRALLEEIARLKMRERRLREALQELYALVEEGWLVRNIKNDGHLPSFLRESLRLVNALKATQDALAAAPEREGR